jgi:hypothetical protein
MRVPWLSRLLLAAAAACAVPFVAVHLAGWRAHTTILSGTWPEGGESAVTAGLAYVLLYTLFVTVVPVTGLWAVFNAAWATVEARRESS